MAAQRIFISYRRSDTLKVVERLFDVLATFFGVGNVFRDVESIDSGVRFNDAVVDSIKRCNICLVVIGPSWLNTKNENGERRLDQTNDPIALEIQTALVGEVPIIPVLVNGASMPSQNDLPELLRDLSEINAFTLSDSAFHQDLSRLCGLLSRYDPATLARKLRPAFWNDLVIPDSCRDKLTLVIDQVRLANTLHNDWQIDSDGADIAVNLAIWGPAGCGKTLSARCIANTLELDLYQISLEELLHRSKTGDRLPIDWLFRSTTGTTPAVLLKDTMGTLAMATSGTKESAMFATSVIRQIAGYGGFIIISSRFPLDNVNISGLQFDHIVELPPPDTEARKYLWRIAMPAALPIADDVDFNVLAQIPLSGLAIKRAVQQAALYAARESRIMSMQDLEKAAQIETKTR